MDPASKNIDDGFNTEARVAAQLRELEARYDLFQYQIDGIHVWQLLRFNVARALQNIPFTSAGNARPQWQWILERIPFLFRDGWKLIFSKRAKLLVKTVSSAFREKEDGKYFDVYFDDLLKDEKDCYKVETLNSPEIGRRRSAAFIPIAITTATSDLFAKLSARLLGPKDFGMISGQISEKLNKEPALRFLTANYIEQTLKGFYWLKCFYLFLLKHVRPNYVLTANTNEFALWAAARELGIVSIEFQHGIFTKDHPDALTDIKISDPDQLIIPDKLFLYGEYWYRELKGNRFCARSIASVGKAQIDRYRKKHESYLASRPSTGPCMLLLTTQGFASQEVIHFMTELLTLSRGRLDISLIIRLHPSYDQQKQVYETGLADHVNVRVLGGWEFPSTYEWLSRSDFHISVGSASHYDALGVGVPTIILPFIGHEIVNQLVLQGHAFLAETPEELLKYLLNHRKMSVPPEVSDYYFTPDAISNMKCEMMK